MLRGFAIEPELFACWRTCRLLLAQLGISHGRMIAEFPKRKQFISLVQRACDEAGVRDHEKTKIQARFLERIREFALPAGARDYVDTLSWIENALTRDSVDPFHAIVARESADFHDRILAVDDDLEESPLWKVSPSSLVERDAKAIAGFVSPLLRISKKIRFVDRFFVPRSESRRRVLGNCLEEATRGERSIEAEYHTATWKGRPRNFESACREEIPRILPRGLTLRFFHWRPRREGQPFHARCILTNRGGYAIDQGFDEGPGVTPVLMLREDDCRQIVSWLDKDSGAYKLLDQFDVP